MIAAVLGWTKLPQWALELILIAAVAGGVWYWQHHLIAEGVDKQKAADAIERKALEADTAKLTAQLQAKASTAEQAYDKERNANLEYQQSHPSRPVRLCLSTDNSGKILPQAGATIAGNATAGTPTPNVSEVPSGNSGGGAGTAGPDISGMLSLLASRADDVSATLREFQTR
jgi:hypothetical protein